MFSRLDSSGNLYVANRFNLGTNSTTGSVAYDDSNWHHLVITNDVSSLTQSVYVDGSVVFTNSMSSNSWSSTATGRVSLGANYSTSGSAYANFLDGSLDQVRIYDTALTSSQVTQLYQENNSTVGTHLFGCIANYNLDGSAKESMGTTAYDGTETDITYRYDGTPTAVDFGVGGKSNYGARFNGSNSILTAPRMFSTNSSYSISFWAKMATGATNEACLIWQISGTSQRSFGLSYSGSGVTYNFGFNHKFATNTGQNNLASFTPDGNWHHFSGSFDSSTNTGSIYIDGNIQGTTFTLDPVSDTGSTLFIGGTYVYNGVTYYNALSGLDQVRVFNKALSSAEVGKLYGNGAGEIACAYTSTTDNVAYPIANTAYYKLDNNSKDSARSTGKFNEGAIFNGSSSYIDTGISSLGANFSVSMWINEDALGSGGFFGNWNGTSNDDMFWLTQSDGSLRINIDGTSNQYFGSAGDVTINTWHHIVVSFNSGTYEVYLDSNSLGTATTSNTVFNSGANFYIGDDNSATYFDGSIDQVRIYNTALDSTDVSNLYAETVSDTSTLSFPSGKTAIATYQLDGNSTDLSGNYNGTDTNVAYAYDGTETNIEYRFGRYGQAAVFNGSGSKITAPSILSSSYTGSVSYSAWFKTSNTANTIKTIIVTDDTTGSISGKVLLLAVSYSGGTSGLLELTGYNFPTFSSFGTTNVADGNWHNVIVVLDNPNATLKVYLDGNSSPEITKTLSSSNITLDKVFSEDWTIGSQGAIRFFDGDIDQVRIFSTALTSSQVTELYNEKPEVDTSNFKAVLYEGTGATQYISNVGMDLETDGGLVWVKKRDAVHDHKLADSVRGATKIIESSTTDAEITATGSINAFNANGFEVGSDSSVNGNGNDFVAWVWKGGGDAVSYSASGSQLAAEVSANTAAGFSIVKWTGDTTSNPTVPHGLNQEPDLYIVKELDNGTVSWLVGGINTLFPETASSASFLRLNTSDDIDQTGIASFGNSGQNLIKVGARTNNGEDSIAYCWHSVAGYSSIGSYSGSGSSGKVVPVGFKPSLVVIKRTNTGGAGFDHWLAFTSNVLDASGNISMIRWDTNQSEFGSQRITFQDTSFTLTDADASRNASNGTYLYMAFK